MKPGFTAVPNDLFEAALRFKCPAGHKEVIFALIRLIEGYHQTERAVSISYLSKFLKQDRSNIAKRLKSLIESNVLKEAAGPGYTEARSLKINRNYGEWKPVKGCTAKSKHDSTAEGGKKVHAGTNASVPGKNTTVAESTTHPVVNNTTNKNTSSLPHEFKNDDAEALKKRAGAGSSSGRIENPETFEENDLTEFLCRIFERSTGRRPNYDELFEFRKQIVSDERFDKKENLEIFRKALHRAAICDESRKSTVYILGIIKSMKLDILKKRHMQQKHSEEQEAIPRGRTSWAEAGYSLLDDFNKLKQKGSGVEIQSGNEI